MPFAYHSRDINADTLRIGLIVLQSDATIELEFQRALAGSEVTCHYARIPSAPEVTPETLRQMSETLSYTASLLPSYLGLRAIGYACTSGSVMIGADKVAALIRETHPNIPIANPMSAAIKACRLQNIKRLGFLSPYIAEVSAPMREAFTASGIAIAAFGSFEESNEAKVAGIDENSTLEAVSAMAHQAECDGFFVSCTNLRSFGMLAEAESLVGKPVMSSNQALLWELLDLSGVSYRPQGFGSLLA